jgi:protein TonB
MRFAYLLAALLALGIIGAPAQSSSDSDGKGQTPPATHFPAGTRDSPVRVSGGVMGNLIQHKVDPIYPEDAKAKGVRGAVVMHAIVDPEGKVDSDKLSVVAGPEPLREAALSAVRQWTYKPFMLNGGPVFVETVVTVNFTPPAP